MLICCCPICQLARKLPSADLPGRLDQHFSRVWELRGLLAQLHLATLAASLLVFGVLQRSTCQDTFQEKSASRLQHFNLFTLFYALLAEHFTATQGRLPQSSCQSHVLQKGAEKLHMLLQVLPATSTSGKDIQILHMESSSAEEHHISHISWFSTQPVSLHLW